MPRENSLDRKVIHRKPVISHMSVSESIRSLDCDKQKLGFASKNWVLDRILTLGA